MSEAKGQTGETRQTGQTGQRGQTGQTEFESKARYNTHFRRWCTERPSK